MTEDILEATFIKIDIHIIIILSLLFTLCFDLNLWCVLSYVCLRMICAAAVSCVSSLSSLVVVVVVVACCCRVTAVCCRILLGIITKKNIIEHLEELEQRAELPVISHAPFSPMTPPSALHTSLLGSAS